MAQDQSPAAGWGPAVLAGGDLLVGAADPDGQAVDQQLPLGARRFVDLLDGQLVGPLTVLLDDLRYLLARAVQGEFEGLPARLRKAYRGAWEGADGVDQRFDVVKDEIDSGRYDEYHLELCATAFHREVVAAGTPRERVHFETFEGTHRGLTWRYPLSLTFLVGNLSIAL